MLDPTADFSWIESQIHSALRVPPYPHLPAGDPHSVQVFRSGPNYYYWRLLVWFLNCLFILAAFAFFHFLGTKVSIRKPPLVHQIWRAVEAFAAVFLILNAIVTYYAQRLDYMLHWYIVTDRSLRIRTGIFWVDELTMTFSNIQDIRVTAGPFQNLLGLADVEVHSAGGSVGTGGHVARFEWVANANQIRDLLVERVRQYKDSGLGEHAHPTTIAPAADTEQAARAVLAEAKLLRAALTKA